MSKRGMTVYLAGPITGIPKHNFPAFDHAKRKLQKRGYKVVSPADIDRSFGITGKEKASELSKALIRKVMLKELGEIFNCDMVALLPGWKHSKGAAVEIAWAHVWEIPVMPLRSVPKCGK